MSHCIAPTPRQIEYQDWEVGLFLHFGIRTFHEGHGDWDGKAMSADNFLPVELDCNQWAEVAETAGMRYAVLTAKHHDGFANWPSPTARVSVADTPWKGGGGDVVGEFVSAFRARGMAVGLYYSPAQWGSESFQADARAYDDYFITQLSEILEPYGPIDLLWLDGCGSAGHRYDWARIVAEVRRLQPELLLFNMGDPDIRWVGNEEGFAPTPLWNVVDPADVPGDDSMRTATVQQEWLPAECDCRLRGHNWFYSDADEETVKPVDVLVGMYECSVGRGCNLLLNVGPDRRGLIPEKDATALAAFGSEIRRRFANPIATLDDFDQVEDGAWLYQVDGLFDVDCLVVQEDISRGEHVRRWRVEFPVPPGITLHEGRSIGHKAICRFPLVRRNKLIFRVLEADGPVRLRSLNLYDTRENPR